MRACGAFKVCVRRIVYWRANYKGNSIRVEVAHSDQFPALMIGQTLANVERGLILETLRHVLGNRTHAANILGISIRTMRNKLNEYANAGAKVPPPKNCPSEVIRTTESLNAAT